MQIDHILPERLLRDPIRVLVVGCGGNGSAIVAQLPYLHQALKAWGHPHGIDVAVMDGDIVSRTNCVRQPFSAGDIGQNKAKILVNRINLFWRLAWRAKAEFFGKDALLPHNARCDILIGAVDTRKARVAIEAAVTRQGDGTRYWLDLGNSAASGQFILGQPRNDANPQKKERLRTVSELFPEIVDISGGEDPLPSCSAAEALDRQEPFINQTLASSAMAMLSRLFRVGRINYHGGFFSAASGRMAPLPVDPERWAKLRARNRKSIAV
jgi:PRTRC genetic system ThiF family protein